MTSYDCITILLTRCSTALLAAIFTHSLPFICLCNLWP